MVKKASSLICYTAIYGGKDSLPPVIYKTPNIKYVCFTDVKFDCDGWEVRVEPRSESTNRLKAKWFKLHPHLLFPEENTLWIDGNCQVKTGYDLTQYTDKLSETHPFALYEHLTRDCSYDEIQTCVDVVADHLKSLESLKQFLLSENYPKHNSLYMGRTLFRHPAASKVNETWWKVISEYSSRDQPSLPYALWKHNVEPVSLGTWTAARAVVSKNGRHRYHGENHGKNDYAGGNQK